MHNVLYAVTEHDSVYAFDAERPGDPPLWQVSFLDRKRSLTTVPTRDTQCPFIQPEVGITATPVIDLKTGTLYVLARTMADPVFGDKPYFQHLHALAITTGVEKFGGPKLISASVPGKGDGSSNGQVPFNPLRENPRAALLLVKSTVYLTWASSCDLDPYHGWIMAYDAETLAQRAVLNVTPDGTEGGIWASDTGPAADPNGNVYVPTGNGTFDAAWGGRDYGDSVLKLALDGSSLALRDYFTPYDQARLSNADADLGSSGPLLLPDRPGSTITCCCSRRRAPKSTSSTGIRWESFDPTETQSYSGFAWLVAVTARWLTGTITFFSHATMIPCAITPLPTAKTS